MREGEWQKGGQEKSLPTNPHRERPLIPISALYDWHLPVGVRAWPVEYLV